MQYFNILFFLLLSIATNAQQMEQIQNVVTDLFVATDENNWVAVEKCFAEKVVLDYSSMSGQPAATLTPKDITTAWKGVLPGFTSTHHQIGNLRSTVDANKAKVFCYGTATHFLEDEGGNVWTVVGTYDFHLQKQAEQWQINRMTFHFKYQDGNAQLVQKAIAKQLTK